MRSLTLLFLFLTSCATPYRSYCYDSSCFIQGGWSVVELDENKYRVRFVGNQYTDHYTVEAYTYKRAKDLCLEMGFVRSKILGEKLSSSHNVIATDCRLNTGSSYGYNDGSRRGSTYNNLNCSGIRVSPLRYKYAMSLVVTCKK